MPDGRPFRKKRTLTERRRRLFYLKTAVLIGFAIWLFIVLAWLSYQPVFTIKEIEFTGLALVDKSIVNEVVEKNTRQKTLGLISRKTLLTLPRSAIKESLYSSSPSIKEVSFDFTGINKLAVFIKEREPVGVWCGLSPSPDPLQENCFFVDEDGFVFSRAPVTTGAVYVRYYGGLANPFPPIGLSLLDKKVFLELRFFLETLKSSGVSVLRVILDDGFEVSLDLAGGGKVIFSLKSDLHKTLDNLEVFVARGGDGDTAKYLGSFQYVDLRFGNKIYFKR